MDTPSNITRLEQIVREERRRLHDRIEATHGSESSGNGPVRLSDIFTAAYDQHVAPSTDREL